MKGRKEEGRKDRRKEGREERRIKGRKKRTKCLKREKKQKEKERRCRMNRGIREQWLASPDKALLLFPASNVIPQLSQVHQHGYVLGC